MAVPNAVIREKLRRGITEDRDRLDLVLRLLNSDKESDFEQARTLYTELVEKYKIEPGFERAGLFLFLQKFFKLFSFRCDKKKLPE